MAGLSFTSTLDNSDFIKKTDQILAKTKEVSRQMELENGKMKAYDSEALKMCDNLNKYFDGLLRKIDTMNNMLQTGVANIDLSTINTGSVSTQQLDELRSKNAELTEQLRTQKDEIKQQQTEWNNLANVIKTNNVNAIEQYKQANATSITSVKEAEAELKTLAKDLDENGKYYDKLTQQAAAYCEELARLQTMRDKGASKVAGDNGTSVPINGEIDSLVATLSEVKANQKSIGEEIAIQRQQQAELNYVVEQGNEKHVYTRMLIIEGREQLIQMRAAGLQNTIQYQQTAEEVGKMRRQMLLVNKEMEFLANPRKNIAMLKAGLTGVTTSANLVVGVMGLFNEKNEKMAELQTKIQSLMAILIDIEGTYGMLKKSNTLMLGIENIQRQATIASMALETKAKTSNIALTWAEVAAQKAFNLVASANPYVLLATALLTVAGAVWMLVKANKEDTKEQEELNKRMKIAKDIQDSYIQTLSSSAASQITTFNKLKKEYNDLGDNLNEKKKFIIENKDAFHDLGLSVNGISDAENILVKQSDAVVNAIMQRAKATAAAALAQDSYKKMIERKAQLELHKRNSKSQDQMAREAAAKQGYNYDTAQAGHKMQWRDAVENQYVQQQRMEEVLQKGVNDLEKAGNSYIKMEAIYNEQSKNSLKEAGIKEYNKNKEKGNKQNEKDGEKTAEERKKEEEKLNEELLTLQKKNIQSAIDLKKEGSEKKIAQIELDYKNEMAAIKEQEEEWSKAKGGKLTEEQSKEISIAYTQTDRKKDKALSDVKQEEAEKLKGLLGEYQDYTDQRLAIEAKFNKDLATLDEQKEIAVKNGDTKLVEQIDRAKAQATKNKGMNLMNMDYEQLKKSPDYTYAFENLKTTSNETLTSLLTQLENAKQSAAQVLSPDQLREYTTAIQEIMNELDSRNPFQALANKKGELAEAKQELADAQMALEYAQQTAEAVKGGAKIENGVKSSKINEKTGKIESSKSYLTEAQALEKVKEKTNEYNAAKNNVVKVDADVKKSEVEVKKKIDELFKAISDVGKTIGGPAGEIISLIGDIGTFTMTAMSGVQAAANTSATIIGTVEKASVILTIISAAFQIAMKIASLFNNDEAYQKEIENLQGRIEQLQWELDNADAIRLQNNTFQALNKVKEVYSETTEEVLKLHAANGKNLNFFERIYLRAKSGNEIVQKSAEKLATAYANISYTADKALGSEKFSGTKEQLQNIAQQQILLQEQIRNEESKKKTDHGKIEDWEHKIQELGMEAVKIINGIVEEIIGGSATDLASELGNAFIEAFQTGEDAAEAWKGKVNDIVADVLKRMLISKFLEEPLGKIFNKYKSKWFDDGTFLGFDNVNNSMVGFASDLNGLVTNFQNGMDSLPDELRNMLLGNESNSQESSKKGFATASQDSIEELNGRFTALQISNEEIKNSMLAMLSGVNLISTTTTTNGMTLSEIRNIALMSNSYLEDIARFTKPLLEVGGKLDRIESNTKGLVSK